MHKIKIESFREKIRQIYSVVAELSALFPSRRFTPDGHMVGSLGEAIAAIEYGVELHKSVTHHHTDGLVGGREVQVKTTQGKEVAVKQPRPGDLLLVIKINQDGTWLKIYDGDSERVWGSLVANKESYMREKTISFKRLQALQNGVSPGDRIPPVALG